MGNKHPICLPADKQSYRSDHEIKRIWIHLSCHYFYSIIRREHGCTRVSRARGAGEYFISMRPCVTSGRSFTRIYYPVIPRIVYVKSAIAKSLPAQTVAIQK